MATLLEEALEPFADVSGGEWRHRRTAQPEPGPIAPPRMGLTNGG
jgi:hypothetical protein